VAEEEEKLGEKNQALKPALTDAQSHSVHRKDSYRRDYVTGGRIKRRLTELASVLHVVEGGDRAVPSQAIAVYKESSQFVSQEE
jgi:hypothetical protein